MATQPTIYCQVFTGGITNPLDVENKCKWTDMDKKDINKSTDVTQDIRYQSNIWGLDTFATTIYLKSIFELVA